MTVVTGSTSVREPVADEVSTATASVTCCSTSFLVLGVVRLHEPLGLHSTRVQPLLHGRRIRWAHLLRPIPVNQHNLVAVTDLAYGLDGSGCIGLLMGQVHSNGAHR